MALPGTLISGILVFLSDDNVESTELDLDKLADLGPALKSERLILLVLEN